MRLRLISASLLLALSSAGWSASPTDARDSKRDGRQVYLVALEGEPLAAWRGGTVQGKRLAPTSPAATGARKLDVGTPASKAYLGHLAEAHASFLRAANAALGRSVAPRFDYTVAVNGMAIELDAAEAEALRRLPGVVAIAPERIDRLMTDAGPAWIGAESVWNGTIIGSNVRTRGEGAVVGVIDTGINATHPSFADVAADGYNHSNPRGRFYGACETTPARCTDKLIGIRDFTTEGARDGSDTDGHGSHVASTAAGNLVDSPIATMTGSIPLRVSGVAPRANIISYKACVEGEGDEPGGCPQSATLAALNQAIADQVDVINYSIGGDPADPWLGVRGALDQEGAFLNARFAGIVGVVAAGNDGPGAGSVASPSNAPWVLSVANVSHDRKFANAISDISGTGSSTPLRFDGQSLSGVPVTARIVDASAFGFPLCSKGDDIDFPPSGASNPFAAGTFNGEIVLCRRGTTGRVTKGFNVKAAGAGGMILYNTAAEGEATVPDDHFLPATHLGASAGSQLAALLTAAGAQGNIRGTITATQGVRTGSGDMLSASSARGPVQPVGGYLKPDIAAPGSGILAAARTGNGLATLSGTSMATPHVAGAAALLAAANPDWNVAQIESALLTTTIDDVVLPDAITRASAHDAGAGRANLANAARAGLWFDVSREAFVAADPQSGSNSPGARDPSSLNRPSLVSRSCLESCTFTRVATAFADGSWRAAAPAVEGITVSVTPAEFSLSRGQSQALAIRVAITDPQLVGRWHFGSVELVPSGTAASLAKTRLPYAVLSDPGRLPDQISINADATNGFRDVNLPGLAALKNARFETGPLVRLQGQSQGLPEDPTEDDVYDLPSAGVFVKLLDPPANLAGGGYGVYVEASSATARDVDLFVGVDDNGDGQAQENEERCSSTSSIASERCAVALPAESNRRVWIVVQNFAASAPGATDIVTVRDGIVPLAGAPSAPKLAATAPGVTEDQRGFPVRISWNEPRMLQGETWIGFAGLGFGAGSVKHVPIALERTNNLVSPIVMQVGATGRDSESIALAPGNAHDRIVIDVPATATAMSVTTAGDGEVDLYVSKAAAPVTGPDLGTAPARGAAQGTSIHPGASERVDLAGAALTPGRWFVTPVNAGSTDARFTLAVEMTESGNPPPLSDNGYYNVARAGHGV
ncbi:MAG TPA: S8 family serine peptidase, partial [Xanthomonadales bacterium]|nr:S8 family serine peptidase [Xanthomonadales bacterium]